MAALAATTAMKSCNVETYNRYTTISKNNYLFVIDQELGLLYVCDDPIQKDTPKDISPITLMR
jgi:hypothetical protein